MIGVGSVDYITLNTVAIVMYMIKEPSLQSSKHVCTRFVKWSCVLRLFPAYHDNSVLCFVCLVMGGS